MALAVSVLVDVSQQRLAQLGTMPSGPLHRYWLRLLAEVDRTAKIKLSNQLVHVRTGNLRSSQQAPFITVTGTKLVGVAQNTARYARFVHDGTSRHDIRPSRGKVLTGWTFHGAPVFTPVVHHPGTKARPWLRQALTEVMSSRA